MACPTVFHWPGPASHSIDLIGERAVHHRLLPLLIAYPLLCCYFFLLQERCQRLTLVLVEGRTSSPDGQRRTDAGSGRRLH
jgi:hypothetical protein